MKSLLQVFSVIFGRIKSVYSWSFSDAGEKFLGSLGAQAARIATDPRYLEIAESIALASGNRTVRELLDVAITWKVEIGIVSGMEAGDVLRVILRSVLKRYLPGTADLVLNLAIEALAAAVKAKKL
jgi:hypothetical protein